MHVLNYIGEMLLGIVSNSVIIVPCVAWLIAQLLKTIISSIVNREVDWRRLIGDGGMPSAHSATVMSLAIVVGDAAGYGGALFGLALMFAIVVMHDASGVRRETGKQAESILKMADVITNYFAESDINLKTEKLKVLVGHTPLQVTLGAVLGAVVAFLYIFIFRGIFGILH